MILYCVFRYASTIAILEWKEKVLSVKKEKEKSVERDSSTKKNIYIKIYWWYSFSTPTHHYILILLSIDASFLLPLYVRLREGKVKEKKENYHGKPPFYLLMMKIYAKNFLLFFLLLTSFFSIVFLYLFSLSYHTWKHHKCSAHENVERCCEHFSYPLYPPLRVLSMCMNVSRDLKIRKFEFSITSMMMAKV